jgi:RHS repeat-associated protein
MWDGGSTMHADAREYSDMEGSWMQPDPYQGSYDLSDPQSLNRYAYVNGKPLSTIDPSGLAPEGGGGFGCGILCQLENIFTFSWGGHSHFHGSTKPRPNAQPWDEYHIHYGPNIAAAFGLPDVSCEFGVCGFSPGSIGANYSRIKIPPDAAFFFGALWYGTSGRQGPLHGLWRYGNFCGGGGQGLPINGLDTGCMLHDYCYFQNGLSAGDNFQILSLPKHLAINRCNNSLCSAASKYLSLSPQMFYQGVPPAAQIVDYFTIFPSFGNGCTQ